MDLNAPPPLDLSEDVPKPPKKKRGVWKVVAMIVGVPVGLIVLLAMLGGVYLMTSKELPVNDADRAVLITIDQANEWIEDYEPNRSWEKFTKLRYMDASYELDYEYEDPTEDEGMFLSCTVAVEASASDAAVTYTSMDSGVRLGGLMGLEFDERNDLLSWGDKSRCVLLTYGGAPVGNYFIARQDERIFMLLVTGAYFDTAEDFQGLVKPTLDRLASYKPTEN